MIILDPTWLAFESLTPGVEAAACSANCLFSFATLEIAHPAGAACFALTERRQPGAWRWAIVNAIGEVTDDGWEPTQDGAKLASATRLRNR
jgi:hypothetical protein